MKEKAFEQAFKHDYPQEHHILYEATNPGGYRFVAGRLHEAYKKGWEARHNTKP